MKLLKDDDCSSCNPSHLHHRLAVFPDRGQVISYSPFIITFLIISSLVVQKLLPTIAAHTGQTKQEYGVSRGASLWTGGFLHVGVTEKRLATAACAVTFALSAVLVELILCEISNTVDPAARGLALRTTLTTLLVLLVVLVPCLQINAAFGSWRKKHTEASADLKRLLLTFLVLAAWLACFWYLPYIPILPETLQKRQSIPTGKMSSFLQGCLKRIGIIGIALMAALAGFAAISSIWQTLVVKKRVVKETDIARKETGLASVQNMLESKESRLRALDRRTSQASAPSKGFLARVAGTFKPDSEANERKLLEIEISGLEAMISTLNTSLASLRTAYADQEQAKTNWGKIMTAGSSVFALYCIYRLATISLSTFRRFVSPAAKSADPISNLLALLTTHYDSGLNYDAWSRQISFAMSGVILLLSFSAVLQTFRLFSRFLPSFIQRANTSLPLVMSQIAGTYVISSALLLRSNLPPQMSSVIAGALETPLDAQFAESWFEGWFLVTAGVTVGGVMISRKVGAADWDDWDDSGNLELGKMS